MNSSEMFTGAVGVVGDWRTLRVAKAHHAIPLPKRRTAAATVASVNRGLT